MVKMDAISRHLEAIDYSGWVTIECPGVHPDPGLTASTAREVARRVLNLI
jgi:sugar phosphate isomerase/epimerase